MLLTSIPDWVNHQLESRMREIRLYGSEGGGAARSPYPYQATPLSDFEMNKSHKRTLSASCLLVQVGVNSNYFSTYAISQ
jgi:hypothetical protein